MTDTTTLSLRDLYPTSRKHCTKCGRWRWIGDFYTCKVRGNIYLKSTCHPCDRELDRYYKGMKRRGRPFEPQTYPRTYVELSKEAKQKHREGLKRHRDRSELETLIPESSFHPIMGFQVDLGKDKQLPVEPLRRWAQIAILECGDVSAVANLCGVEDTTIRNIAHSESKKFVQESVADALLTRLRGPALRCLWPDYYD